MSDSISRRQFVKTGAAASVAAGLASAATGQGPSVLVRKATPPVVIASSNGHEHKNGGAAHLRRGGLAADREGRGRARVVDRRRQHRRARPRGHERRLRRAAERRRRRAARLLLHARSQQARRRRRLARRRAHAVARRQDGARPHRPPPAGRARRAGLRAQHGLFDRGRPQHRALAREVARVEAPHRPEALPRPEAAEPGRRGRVAQHGARGAARPAPPLRHDQLRRRLGERRGVRRDHHERARLQDPRPGGGLADPGRGAVGGRRLRRRGLDREGRGQPVQPVLLLHRRGAAARKGREGRRHGGAAPRQGGDGREAAARPRRPAGLPARLLRAHEEGRVRRRLDVGRGGRQARALRGVHRRRPGRSSRASRSTREPRRIERRLACDGAGRPSSPAASS